MDKSTKILITGATGAVGPLVVQAFHSEGYQVRTFSLDQPPLTCWPANVETHVGDITNRAAVEEAMQGVDAVVHMAALLHIVNPSAQMRTLYESVNVGGTKHVVDAAFKNGVKRVVLFSTIAVYGASAGQVLDETSPVQPDTFYSQTKHHAEQIVLKARGTDNLPIGTVLRLGAVYGSRIKGNYERLTNALAHHRFIPIGDGQNRRTLIYDKDVGRAALLAVIHDSAAGRLYNVTDGSCHTMQVIIEAICSALGRSKPLFSLPAGVVRMLAGFIEKSADMAGFAAPVTRATIDKYTEDIAVDGSLIQRELGFKSHYDLEKGWVEAIKEMRNEKII